MPTTSFEATAGSRNGCLALGAVCSAAPAQTEQTYCSKWKNEIEKNDWTFCLDSPEYALNDVPRGATILDISSTGVISHFWVDPFSSFPGPHRSKWKSINKTRLRASGLNATTRIIMLEPGSFHWCQDLIGLEYDIEPAVFSRIARSRATAIHSSWPLHDCQLPDYMIGVSPHYLEFGFGWFGKIIINEQDPESEPKNVSKCLLHSVVPARPSARASQLKLV